MVQLGASLEHTCALLHSPHCADMVRALTAALQLVDLDHPQVGWGVGCWEGWVIGLGSAGWGQELSASIFGHQHAPLWRLCCCRLPHWHQISRLSGWDHLIV